MRSGNRGEKVLCSLDTWVGISAASSVPKSKGTSIRPRRETAKENPAGRRLRVVKKEEDFSANPPKKTRRKKIPFQTVSFASIPLRSWQRAEELQPTPGMEADLAPGMSNTRISSTLRHARYGGELLAGKRRHQPVLQSRMRNTRSSDAEHQASSQLGRWIPFSCIRARSSDWQSSPVLMPS